MTLILLTLLISYTLLFLYSLRIRDNSIVDVFWGFGFMVIVVVSFFLYGTLEFVGTWSYTTLSQYIVTGLVLLWGIRLTSHIGFRKLREGKEDPRYAAWREEWGSGWYFMVRSFFQVYMLQMLLMLVVSIPILVVNIYYQDLTGLMNIVEFDDSCDGFAECLSVHLPGFEGRIEQEFMSMIILWIGTIFSIFGLVFETIADRQLGEFLKIKKPGQIFTTGLYRYSRHPNYFGESMFWLGVSIISLQFSYLGLVGWITITFLLLFVSGVPLQEARYEGRPEWEEYKKKTSVFVPWWPKK